MTRVLLVSFASTEFVHNRHHGYDARHDGTRNLITDNIPIAIYTGLTPIFRNLSHFCLSVAETGDQMRAPSLWNVESRFASTIRASREDGKARKMCVLFYFNLHDF
jgi:hypothetical protein